MAAKPIERFVKKQIADQGGWPRILERIASGETYTQIAHSLKRPFPDPNTGKDHITFAFFRRLLHQDPARAPDIAQAKRIRAEAWADDALAKSDATMNSQVDVGKARVQIDARLRLAGFADREQYGERKQVEVTGDVTVQHLDSLRHRMIEASRPLAEALHQVLPFRQLSAMTEVVAVEASGNGTSHAQVEQNDTCLTDTRDAHGRPLVLQSGASIDPPQKE